MHLFQHGNHGVGLASGNPQLNIWPELLIKWMRERGLAAAADTPPANAAQLKRDLRCAARTIVSRRERPGWATVMVEMK